MKDWAIVIILLGLTGFSSPGAGDQKSVWPTPFAPDRNCFQAVPKEDSIQYDGPYVFYRNEKIIIKTVLQANGTRMMKQDSVALPQKQTLLLKVGTDEPGKFFSVTLKDKLEEEKASFKGVKKQLILSDIEGNFAAFRKLLQATRVIDSDLNWSFGDGHLVLIGDFFDRGEKVTELLWFIYSLEQKAKAAGGYVHFILGNHEIMNLSGDFRYVNAKYTTDAVLLGEDYGSFYAANTELGRWLRTKNIIEKVGELLYVHAGLSPDINALAIPARDINRLARPYYADSSYDYKDRRLAAIMIDQGPFWYRGYYSGNPRATEQQIDSSLEIYNARHIVTGHSIVADTVSAWYNGKLFNTDTHHAAGKSEALLFEDNRFYRINAAGTKVLLPAR